MCGLSLTLKHVSTLSGGGTTKGHRALLRSALGPWWRTVVSHQEQIEAGYHLVGEPPFKRQLRWPFSCSLIRTLLSGSEFLPGLLAAQHRPAVHVKDLARDVLGPLRSEKHNRQRDVVSGRNSS